MEERKTGEGKRARYRVVLSLLDPVVFPLLHNATLYQTDKPRVFFSALVWFVLPDALRSLAGARR